MTECRGTGEQNSNRDPNSGDMGYTVVCSEQE